MFGPYLFPGMVLCFFVEMIILFRYIHDAKIGIFHLVLFETYGLCDTKVDVNSSFSCYATIILHCTSINIMSFAYVASFCLHVKIAGVLREFSLLSSRISGSHKISKFPFRVNPKIDVQSRGLRNQRRSKNCMIWTKSPKNLF